MPQHLTNGWRWAVLLLGFGVLLEVPLPAHGQEPSPLAVQPSELQEAEQLNQQALKLQNEGKYDAALPLAQQALAIRERVLGSEHPDVAQSLSNLAILSVRKKDYSRAELLLQRVLAIQEKALGPEHPTVAHALDELASLYFLQNDHSRAEPLYQRALTIREKALGLEHLKVVTSLTFLAILYTMKGDHSRVESLWQRALAIREKSLGAEHIEVAESLDRLAGFYLMTHDYGRAEPLYQRALAIREKALGPEHLEVARSLDYLARVYLHRVDYNSAEPLLQRALTIQEKALGPEHPNVADTLSRLAELYDGKGNYSRAESLYQRALAILEQALGSEHPEVAITLDSLAGLFTAKADYGRAELFYQRALAIREKVFGPEDQKVATLLDHLAALYVAKADYGRAEPLYLRALAILENTQQWPEPLEAIATTLEHLAQLYWLKGDAHRAESFYQRTLATVQQRWGPEHFRVARILHSLAELYEEKGDYSRAESLHLRVLAIREKIWGSEHTVIATTLNNLALLYARKGDYSRAEPLFLRALALYEKARWIKPPYNVALSNLATLYWVKGDLTRAITFRTRSEDASEHNLSLMLATGSEDQKRAYVAPLTSTTGTTVSLHTYGAPNDLQGLRLAFTTILRRKGRVLDAMTDSMTALRRRLDLHDQVLLDQLLPVRSQLATLMLKGPERLSPALYQAQVSELTVRAQKLEAQISARSAEFRMQTQPVTLQQVQHVIPPQVALVELVSYQPFNARVQKREERWGAQRYAAYILHREGEPTWVDLGEAVPIDQAVTKLRHALSTPGRTDVQELARALDDKVMRPIRPLLGDARLILLSPDGALNLVPFGVLVDEDNHYLIERFTFVYLTTGRDLVRLQIQSQERQSPVIVANPDFDGGGTAPLMQVAATTQSAESRRSLDFANLRFESLPGTAGEATELKALLWESEVLTGATATEAALKQVHGPRILHVATHGFFLADQRRESDTTRGVVVEYEDSPPRPQSLWVENPLLRSGLALAGANQRQSGNDDGVLTALEATGLDLWGTKLVVLSACETGVGAVQNGEGVYGLRRALIMAGAESQVMSLWKVADEATRDLMVAYYRRLLSGEGRAEALRQVQLTMLASADRSHPFYWASFIPSGQWAPIGGQEANRP